MSDLLDLLGGAARDAAEAGAGDVEVSHQGRVLGMTRFASSGITQAGVVHEQMTRVRVALGDRVGAATTSELDPAGLAAAARHAIDAARSSPPQKDFPGFARAGGAGHPDAVVAATAAFSPGDRARILAEVFARAGRDRLLCAGAFTTSRRQVAVVTSGGTSAEHQATEAQLSLICLDGDASGYAVFFGPDVTRLDAAALVDEAAVKAARSRQAEDLPAAAYDVVLGAPAVAELCEWMALTSFSGRAVIDGTSLLCGRDGELLCDPRVTIAEAPFHDHPASVPSPFDSEGVPRQTVTFIAAGRAGQPVTDLTTGARLGRGSTGHAPALGNDLADGPIPAQLVFHPGEDSVPDLIDRVARGLLITRFHYVNGLLDTPKATMTGMTRDGTFLIENGKVGSAVKNLRFTESILAALGRVGGIGRDLQAVPTSWAGHGAYLCPALLLRGFHFTGRSR